jgi:hypothetical protein
MRQINDHMKDVMGIKQTNKNSSKDTSMKIVTWSAIAIITVVLWTVIYNLIF